MLMLLPTPGQEVVVALRHPTGSAATAVVQPTAGNPLAASCADYNQTSISCAYPINVTAGNTAYVLVFVGAKATIGTPSCSSGTATIGTFTLIANNTRGGEMAWYSASITGSGSCTVSATITAASTNETLLPFEVSGSGGIDSGTNPVFAYPDCTATCSTPGITTSTANDLLLFGLMYPIPSATFSALTPYTLSGQDGTGPIWMTGNYTAASAGKVNGSFSNSGASTNTQMSVLAIK